MPLSLDQSVTFFGWCTVVNSVILTLFTIVLMLGSGWIARLHSRLFALAEDEVKLDYFRFLANYKLLILAFNITPFIALKILQISV